MNTPKLRLKLRFENGLSLGPGKADLLQGIAAHGSISAAGRRMKMSYKRAWMLVEEMNAAFQMPLVESNRGGQKGGGARLTEAGEAALAHYRELEAITLKEGANHISGITNMLKNVSD
ncbi:MAG: LysR family transcriptional regulator [Hoeflea sp.]|uniref:winged helix-turn-helix domain-containing protein n=1 Tax=Hoeflea sp. TaxID=1940281 RepID=UPI00329A51A5